MEPATQTVKVRCFCRAPMQELLEALRPCGVTFRRGRWWQADFIVTAPAEFAPTLRERLDAALALDDIDRRAW